MFWTLMTCTLMPHPLLSCYVFSWCCPLGSIVSLPNGAGLVWDPLMWTLISIISTPMSDFYAFHTWLPWCLMILISNWAGVRSGLLIPPGAETADAADDATGADGVGLSSLVALIISFILSMIICPWSFISHIITSTDAKIPKMINSMKLMADA